MEGYLHWEKQIFISGPGRRKVFGTPISYLAQPCLEERDQARRGVEGERRGRAGSQASLGSNPSSATTQHCDPEPRSSCLCVLSGNMVLRTLQPLGVDGVFNEMMCA